jgi:ankyrin repeat protein
MSTTDRRKSNGTRLSRLIIDQGTKTLRMFLDSIHPPATLNATLHDHYDTLRKIKCIRQEMKNFFPPSGVLPAMQSTPEHYDITTLSILIRNICGLRAPVSTGSWNEKPPSTDISKEADLVRIKLYRNKLYAHIHRTDVSDADFDIYWREISDALQRLSLDLGVDISGDIAYLKTCNLDDGRWIEQLDEWYRNDKRSEDLMGEIKKNTRYLQCLMGIAIFSVIYLFLSSYFQKESDYFYPQNFSNPSFVGREWVFRTLENILNASDVRGVQLVIDPGWGKSAIMKRLIHSPSSSAVIHENIIGYHFCKFNEESTRDGEEFVKNLVKLIAKKIPEFRKIVNKDQLIKDELQSNCKKNPIECFQKAIVEPLQKLNAIGRNNSFILIDALDECLEKEEGHKSIIVNILSSSADNVPELPTWVKLIVTSRNQAQATGKISKIHEFSTLHINITDSRNLQDLRNYAKQTLQMFYSEVPSLEEKLPLNRSIDLAVEFSKGNFLFLEGILKLWRKYPDKMNAEYIPEDLGGIYATAFSARFEKADFSDFQPLLEVLLAANSPPMLLELDRILNHHYKNYNTRTIVLKLSEYFKSDIDQGPLEFHHQFFAEWLIKQTHGSNGIVIQKSRGHQYIVDYLFHFYSERQTDLTYEELTELCMHILHGEKATVSNLKSLASLDVSAVRDSWKRCILHYLAFKRNSTDLIAVFIKQFNSVDILDFLKRTPVIYAVEAGIYKNVKLFINEGANVNYAVEPTHCIPWYFMTPNDFPARMQVNHSVNFVAAYKGYTKIAELLIKSGAKKEKANKCGWKALHWAALMGHFEIVQLYINKGAQPDLISLYHAAAKNHTEIVRFLLNTGVRDKCLLCEPRNISWCNMNVNQFHHCFCETALHAVVLKNNLEVAKLILQYGNASVNCKHGSGRTPLMEALSRKYAQMVELLRNAGADNNNAKYESSDNVRWSPTSFAVINDQADFINTTYGNRINSIPNIETILRYVAVCYTVETLKHILNSGDLSKFKNLYEDGKTLLHFATLGSSECETLLYVTRSCASSACVCPNMTGSDIAEKKRLETVQLLLKVLVSDINKQDKYGRTALHYAAVHVLQELVEYLVNAGADWSLKDQRGDTALEYALRERRLHMENFLPCRLTNDQVFQVCQSNRFDELASYLLQNASIKKCDTRAKSLLGGLLRHKLPLSLYTLFKSGLDVNCAHEQFKEYLMSSLIKCLGGRHPVELLEILKNFQINVEVVCDVPFGQSELHLMAYLGTSPHSVGNLFQPSVNNTQFPLQRFIASHPKGVEILNECYDKEGYLAIHRAVQGTNFHAVSWFIEIGVNVSMKTKSGLTPLALSVYNLRIFEILLERMKEENHASFHCNTEIVDLSPLHIAGSRGVAMMKNIHRKIPALPLNCTNSDGIQPIYLAYLYHAVCFYISWHNKQIFQDLGLSPEYEPSKYPEREAEYHLIYNQFYRTPQEDLRNMLSHEGLFECPGINELLPHKTEIRDYKRVKACATRCWRSAFEASREFSSNFPYVDIQNIISNPFTDKFLDIAHHMAELRFHLVKMFHFNSFHSISTFTLEKELWRKVRKAHSCAHSCSCFEIMQLLQEKFTSESREGKNVGFFVAERMDWTDITADGDVKYRWPFSFLLKKALRTDKAYKYLEILSPDFNRDSINEYSY